MKGRVTAVMGMLDWFKGIMKGEDKSATEAPAAVVTLFEGQKKIAA